MVRLPIASLLVLALAPACADDDSLPDTNATLADLQGLRLRAEIRRHIVGGNVASDLSLVLTYDPLAFQVAHDGECARLDDTLKVTWSGTTESFQGRGSRYPLADDVCQPLTYERTVTVGGPTELAVGDASFAFSARFEDPMAGRSASLVAGPAELTAGATMTLGLTHPGDFGSAYLGPTVDALATTPVAAVTNGSSVDLTMPSPLPFAGDGVLFATLGSASATVTSCPDEVACELTVGVDYRAPVRLAR